MNARKAGVHGRIGIATMHCSGRGREWRPPDPAWVSWGGVFLRPFLVASGSRWGGGGRGQVPCSLGTDAEATCRCFDVKGSSTPAEASRRVPSSAASSSSRPKCQSSETANSVGPHCQALIRRHISRRGGWASTQNPAKMCWVIPRYQDLQRALPGNPELVLPFCRFFRSGGEGGGGSSFWAQHGSVT